MSAASLARRAAAALACAALVLPSGGIAATHRLDDSLSQVFPPAADWQWVPFSLRGGNSELRMHVRVNVRIDTRAWRGHQARIYMVMPPDAGPGVTATWETDGRLLGGSLSAGERALVYAGEVPGPFLEDRMRVRLAADSRLPASGASRLAFHFEIETP